MFPLLALAALAATGFGAYQYGKNKELKKNNSSSTSSSNSIKEDSGTAKNMNTYNYYTNESENGNTLFGSQKKTKRTLFGGEAV